MKKLSLTAVLVILLATCVFAHEGSIGLFTEETAVHCDYEPALFEQVTMYMVYYKSDSGPDGISAFEFKLEVSASVQFSSATWQQGFITNGDVMAGISVATGGCYGSGMQYAPLGNITVWLIDVSNLENEYAWVIPDPGAEITSVLVSTCAAGYPLHEVLGGWFIFNRYVGGGCNTSTAPASWGAIKTIYKN